MLKEYNQMMEQEKDYLAGLLDSDEKFVEDFMVDGEQFSKLSSSEKAIVYMHITVGSDKVKKEDYRYDDNLKVFNEDEHIVVDTPYGIIGIGNDIQENKSI